MFERIIEPGSRDRLFIANLALSELDHLCQVSEERGEGAVRQKIRDLPSGARALLIEAAEVRTDKLKKEIRDLERKIKEQGPPFRSTR